MRIIFKNILRKSASDEKGQALILVLVLLLVGSLTIMPLMTYMETGLKTDQMYRDKAEELYAADSGVEDSIWQIKYDRLDVILDSPSAYDTYDFSTTWTYELDEQINGVTANISVQNIWIPKDVTPPTPTEGRDIIESGKLIVAGTATDDTNYRVLISFYPDTGEESSLDIESLGIWLPVGFSYTTGSSNLEQDPMDDFYAVPTVSDHNGGTAIIWDYSSAPVAYTDFSGVSTLDTLMTTEITFQYTADEAGERPISISWMETDGVSDAPLSWDVDTKIYKTVSLAGDTEIEAFASRCELRKMEAAIAGDYRAIGNSLMQDNSWPYDKRDTLLSESSTEISDIPNDPATDAADVIAAYLYWSGWIDSGFTTTIWSDSCANFDCWTNTSPNTVWQISSGRFRGHYTGSDADARYLQMTDVVDLSSYSAGSVVVEWDQAEGGSLEPTDGLQFQISSDNGSSWSTAIDVFHNDIGSSEQYYYYIVPEEYMTSLFTMRFYLDDFDGSSEYCYIDDFAVAQITGTGDDTAVFEIDGVQVYLDGSGDPQQGVQDITATRTQVIGNKNRGEYSYSSYLDVTKLVQEYAEIVDEEYHTGNADYTVGSVNADIGEYWSYAGWSLIIVYSSPATAGHQLYLYDTFAFSGGDENLDFDGDGQPGGDIAGFVVPEPIDGEVNAAKLTCFVGEGDDNYDGDYLTFNGTNLSDGAGDIDDVWDSQSLGISEPGVDIDTFYVTWASGLLEADDIDAHIDLPSQVDNWNLIYMILSLRSETVTGSTEHYVIRSN